MDHGDRLDGASPSAIQSRRRGPLVGLVGLVAQVGLAGCAGGAMDDASTTASTIEEITSSSTQHGSTAAPTDVTTSSTTTPAGPQGICPNGSAPLNPPSDPWWWCEIDPPRGCCPGWKCNAVGTGLYTAWWDRYLCVPLEKYPGKPGDPCTIAGDPFSGIDTCEVGSMCWSWDYSGAGHCVAFCRWSEGDPSCPDPSTYCMATRVIAVCLPRCDPLNDTCPAGEACRFDGYGGSHFTCMPAGPAAYGESCDNDWECDESMCVAAEHVPGCAAERCCTRYCDVDAPNPCPGAPAQSCAPLFPGSFEPAYAKIGVCATGPIEPW